MGRYVSLELLVNLDAITVQSTNLVNALFLCPTSGTLLLEIKRVQNRCDNKILRQLYQRKITGKILFVFKWFKSRKKSFSFLKKV
jgi:hypothetical protein